MMRSVVCGVCAVLAGGLALFAAGPSAAEGRSPVIGHVATTEVGEHEVKVEAPIDSGGLETSYEFRLVWQQADPTGGPTNNGESPVGGEQSQTGHIAAGSGNQAVSVSFTNLQWGYTYWYVIAAINSAGKTKGESPYSFGFHISGEFPNGMGTGPPYESEIPFWYEKLSEEESAKTLKEYEARHAKELEAQHLKEAEEQRNREAAAVAEAAALKLLEEEEAQRGRGGGAMLASTNIAVQHGVFSLTDLECYGATTCFGRLILTARTTSVAKNGRRHPRRVVIGTTDFSVQGDSERIVKVKMNRTGRELLNTANRRLDANLEIDERLPNAGWTHTKQTVRLIWRASRRKVKR